MPARQTNFLHLLAPSIPLNPNIITPSDSRFPAALDELRTCRYFGFDTEFYGPWQAKKDIDHTRAVIRLMQFSLPSGPALILDLGGIYDDRLAILTQLEQPLSIIQTVLQSREQLTVGQALKGDAVALECNFGFKLRAARDLMLFSQVLWAGVGAAKPKKPKDRPETPEERSKRLTFKGLRHTLQAIAQRCGYGYVDKTEQASDWSGHLTNQQLNYSAEDVLCLLPIWRKLAQWVKEAGLVDSVLAECEALPAFAECEYHGLPVDWTALEAAIAAWTRAKDQALATWIKRFNGIDPKKKEKVAVALSKAFNLSGNDRLYTLGEPGKNGKRKIIPRVNDESLIPFDSETPGNKDCADPDLRELYECVHAFLEHNSIFVQLKYLEGFRKKYHKGYVRPKFMQIAMGSEQKGKEGETGKGMGRASASNPNSTNSPNLQPAHKAMGLPPARGVVKPKAGHGMLVADLSAAHARIATQASLDPVLIDIFGTGKDVHCVTAQGLLKQKGHEWEYPEVFNLYSIYKKYAKALEKGLNPTPINNHCFEVASTRALSKGVFYGSINLQGPPTLKKTGETGPEPVFMTLDQAAEGIQSWRSTYRVLHGFQRETIRKANRHKVRFDVPGKPGTSPYTLGLPGEYAEVRGLTNRRLFLLKEEDKHGRVSCKGTDCVSFVWMGTEADIIKRAMGRILLQFDLNPHWGARFWNMEHDGLGITYLLPWEEDVAKCVQAEIDAAMQWVIKCIPVSDGDWKGMIVGSWAAK